MSKELKIDSKKVKLYDSVKELLQDYKLFKINLLITYILDDKKYYHADTPGGQNIGILENVVFGEPPSWSYYCDHFKEVDE